MSKGVNDTNQRGQLAGFLWAWFLASFCTSLLIWLWVEVLCAYGWPR